MIVLKPFMDITDEREVVSGESARPRIYTDRACLRRLESTPLRGSMHHEDGRFFILMTA